MNWMKKIDVADALMGALESLLCLFLLRTFSHRKKRTYGTDLMLKRFSLQVSSDERIHRKTKVKSATYFLSLVCGGRLLFYEYPRSTSMKLGEQK